MKSDRLRRMLLESRQSLYITTNLFFQNSLPTIASACAFGLLFSVLPVVFLIISILVRVLHTDHSFIMKFYRYLQSFVAIDQFESLVQSALSVKNVGTFEVISVIFIFWLARRFFLSVMRGFHIIYHQDTARKGISFTLFGFIGETISVVGIAIMIAGAFTARSVLNIKIFTDIMPWIDGTLYPLLVAITPPVLQFLIILLTYRYAPGTKPDLWLCVRGALYTTLTYKLMQLLFKLFINTSRYNMIYGVLSNVMVVLLEAGVFFQIYLFFAQFVYVRQFLDQIGLEQMYLLPDEKDQSVIARLRRKLFFSDFITLSNKLIHIKKDEIIYAEGYPPDFIYCVADGIIEITRRKEWVHEGRGTFFGELSCLTGKTRTETVKAVSPVTLIRIEKHEFEQLLSKNPEVNRKFLSQIRYNLD